MTPTAYLSYLRSAFSVEAISDTATMDDIDEATMWAVNLWQPADGRTLSRSLPPWCVLGYGATPHVNR